MYKTLFKIKITHEYFSEGIEDINIVPLEKTKKIVASGHFLIKKNSQEISVLFSGSTEKVAPLFEFYIFPATENIRAITEISEAADDQMLLFTNEGLGQQVFDLNQSIIAQESSFKGYNAIAKIQINTNTIGRKEVLYFVNFKAKSIKWKYYFISKINDKIVSISSRNEQLNFKELDTENDTSDTRLNDLQLNFPNAQVKIFESDTAIPFRQKPIKDIKLLQDEEQLIKHLPNPKITDAGVQIIKIM